MPFLSKSAIGFYGIFSSCAMASSFYVVVPLSGALPDPPLEITLSSIEQSPNLVLGDTGQFNINVKNKGSKQGSVNLRSADATLQLLSACPAVLPPDSTCSATAYWTPITTGTNVTEIISGSSKLSLTTKVDPELYSINTSIALFNLGSIHQDELLKKSLLITNNGNRSVTIKNINGQNSELQVSNSDCLTVLAPNSICTVSFNILPKSQGAKNYNLEIISDHASALVIPVEFNVLPVITTASLSKSSENFGKITAGASTATSVVLSNTGNKALNLPENVVSGLSAPFSATDNCSTILAVNSSCEISIKYAPTAKGTYSQVASINAGAAGSLSFSAAGTAAAFLSTMTVYSGSYYDSYGYSTGLGGAKALGSATNVTVPGYGDVINFIWFFNGQGGGELVFNSKTTSRAPITATINGVSYTFSYYNSIYGDSYIFRGVPSWPRGGTVSVSFTN